MKLEKPIAGTTIGPMGYMKIEDAEVAWVRPRTQGKVEPTKEKNLSDYSALDILKLANSLAQIYVEKYQAKKAPLQQSTTSN